MGAVTHDSVAVGIDPADILADGILTVREASGLARQSVSSIYLAMERGELPYLKLGRSRRIPRRSLLAWLALHLVGSTSVGYGSPASGLRSPSRSGAGEAA